MKYVFVTGVPGSRWSSVIKNIYYSPSVDRSDHSAQRTYAHHSAYQGSVMHLGSYFDPGMEFGQWFDRLSQHSKAQCESEFDRPFGGQGLRIVKSHVFCYHLDFLQRTWPDCCIVMIHRDNQASFDWWVSCGGFDIGYPNYVNHYKNLDFMAEEIARQNSSLMQHWHQGTEVHNNHELCAVLGMQPVPDQYHQIYAEHDVRVSVILPSRPGTVA